ncbi:MAG: hypothetical protein GVY08_14340 [Bacteroidetes bacterium]|nr:hypothetical protein [Bacteroidota bacterium]
MPIPMVTTLNPINALLPLTGFRSPSLDLKWTVDVIYCLEIFLESVLQSWGVAPGCNL